MSKALVTTIKTVISGDGTSNTIQPPDISNNTAIAGGTEVFKCTGAADTVTVPTVAAGYSQTANGFMLIPPAGSSVAKTLKGISGDTGLPIHPSKPFVWFFPSSPPANFVILSGSAETVEIVWL